MSYDLYVWKWASNDSPGRIEPIIENIGDALLPPSVGVFDVDEFLASLAPMFGSRESEDCPFVADGGEDRENGTAWVTFNISWSAAKKVTPMISAAAAEAGLTAYDPQADRIPEPCRPKAFVVEIEGQKPIYDPTEQEVLSLLGRLDSRSRSFVILESSNGSYLQCAGHPKKLTVEWRANLSPNFRHSVGGKPRGSSATTKVPSSQGFVTVLERQVLTLQDAAPIFAAFLAKRPIDTLIEWSDVTARFL